MNIVHWLMRAAVVAGLAPFAAQLEAMVPMHRRMVAKPRL